MIKSFISEITSLNNQINFSADETAINIFYKSKEESKKKESTFLFALLYCLDQKNLFSSDSLDKMSKSNNLVRIDPSQELISEENNENNSIPEYMVNLEKILCFLQLLCENHNLSLQNFLREQTSLKNSYNLVEMTMEILDILCGGTTGGLGLIGLYVNSTNVRLVAQCIKTLTEYCQGPCHENQVFILLIRVSFTFYFFHVKFYLILLF